MAGGGRGEERSGKESMEEGGWTDGRLHCCVAVSPLKLPTAQADELWRGGYPRFGAQCSSFVRCYSCLRATRPFPNAATRGSQAREERSGMHLIDTVVLLPARPI
jgi:hypothetical protein